MKTITLHSASKQRGLSLLEALLGMLIFSIGILAVVGLQAIAVKSVAESKYRMDASFLANEIISEMWANRSNLGSYNYAGGAPPLVLTRWIDKVDAALPGVVANPPSIVVGAGNEVTVTIFWQHPEEAALDVPPPPHQYVAVASINCC